jgi:hypothetical protein
LRPDLPISTKEFYDDFAARWTRKRSEEEIQKLKQSRKNEELH